MNRRPPKAQACVSRRSLLGSIAALPMAALGTGAGAAASHWVRQDGVGWPEPSTWDALARQVQGRLAAVQRLDFKAEAVRRQLSNPFYISGEPALTQSSGWIDAWTCEPSAYVLTAESARDIARAVEFARRHRVRLVVKGGGHSYLGGSNAPDSLLIWTRRMDQIVVHDAFTSQGSTGPGVPAVSVGAGCLWGHVYDAVTTQAGRYVQGGGCTTVGVAGLVQGGGFGSFSKAYGLAAAGLLEAEIVTADGAVRVVNPQADRDLFWALKGGGGGAFGVVTRLTLQTHDLPTTFGAVLMSLKARSDTAFRDLLERFLGHYREHLFNPHWGEQVQATPDNELMVRMVFQGLDASTARADWSDFLAAVEASVGEFEVVEPPQVLAIPARQFWNPDVLETAAPGLVARDPRPGAPRGNWWWRGDGEQAGATWHGYSSMWLPSDLLAGAGRARLAQAWFEASRHWPVALHFNKGLAGASPDVLAASRETAMNPQVLDAFALAIIAGGGPSSYPGADPGFDLARGRSDAEAIARSMQALRQAAPEAGSYLSECDYHLQGWRSAAWGAHWPRLAAVKRQVDPDGLFLVHHGVQAG